jgi:N-acylneuraminate cytidylyltransferase
VIHGFILARGGSKRIPRKNIRPMAGVPLMGWTIDAARRSAWLDRIIVSSEDDEILAVAMDYGVEAVRRPRQLATDDASSYDALFHALLQWPCHYAVLLQPTSPLRTPGDIDGCIARCVDSRAMSAVTTCNGRENGAVYVARTDWLRATQLYGDPTMALHYEMPPERSIDVDTIEDFARAEEAMRAPH